jgi:integrase
MQITSDRGVRAAPLGEHTIDGAVGLILRVHAAIDGALTRTWIVRVNDRGQRRRLGLGQYPAIGLAEARHKAADAHRAIAKGIDPSQSAKARQRAAEAARALTLGKAIDDYLANAAPTFKNAKSDAIRTRALHVHFEPLRDTDVAALSSLDVAAVLRLLAPHTAIKAHTAIRAVFDFAATILEPHGVRISNPADPRRLKSVGWTPKPQSQNIPHPAVDWRQMPEVISELGRIDGAVASCLQFIIATCVRAQTARLAKWRDLDLEKGVWTVTQSDLKEGKHRKTSFVIPLNSLALEVLKTRQPSSPYVFATTSGKPIGEMDLVRLTRHLRRAHDDWRDPQTKKPFVTHGFRASFKTWSREANVRIIAPIPVRELAELALGHTIGSEVEQAYDRSSLLEARRELMDLWSSHCRGAQILQFPARA